MYQIKCDNNIIYDVRDESLKLINPKVNLEVNTVGSAAFTIYNNHPCYGLMAKLKSVFEVSDEIGVIFRGRQTSDTLDFYKGKAVALELQHFPESKKPCLKNITKLTQSSVVSVKKKLLSGGLSSVFVSWRKQRMTQTICLKIHKIKYS